MAAIIWTPGTLINPAVVDSLMSSAPNPGDSERYFQCADRMMAVITGGGGGGETIYCDKNVSIHRIIITSQAVRYRKSPCQ